MRIAVVDPMSDPRTVEIEPDARGSYLSAMQELVGGCVEPFEVLFGCEPTLYVGDESLIDGSFPNRAVYATREMAEKGYVSQITGRVVREGELYYVLCGTFIAVSHDWDPEEGLVARDITDGEFDALRGKFAGAESRMSGIRAVQAIRSGMVTA